MSVIKSLLPRLIKYISYIIAVFIILLIVSASISYALNPYLNKHNQWVVAWASKVLQQPVAIADIAISWQGLEPAVTLRKVTIFTDDNKPFLQLAKLRVGVALLPSLLHRRIEPHFLEITGMHLTISQNSQGEITIAGFNHYMPGKNTPSFNMSPTIVKFLERGQIAIDDVTIDWHAKDGSLITLNKLGLNSRSNLFGKQIIGSAFLQQAGKPAALEFILQLSGHAMNLAPTLTAYINITDFMLAPWLKGNEIHGFRPTEGVGDLAMRVELKQGILRYLHGTIACKNLVLGNGAKKKILKVSGNGQFDWQRHKQDWRLIIDPGNLAINDKPWPTTHLVLTDKFLQVDYLRLQDAVQALLPTGLVTPRKARLLASLQPQGDLQDFILHYDAKALAVNNFRIDTKFDAVSINPSTYLPGVKQLSGYVSLGMNDGSLQLVTGSSSIVAAKLFSQPLAFDNVNAHVHWQKSNDAWQVIMSDCLIKTPANTITGNMQLWLPKAKTPHLDLAVNFAITDLAKTLQYLPLTTLHPHLAGWFSKAFPGTGYIKGDLIIHGPLALAPFVDDEGKLMLRASFHDVALNYAKYWPILEDLAGNIVINNKKLQITATSGKVTNATIVKAKADIADLTAPILQASGKVLADLQQGLNFLQHSPLNKTVGQDFDGMSLAGPMDLALRLNIPLRDRIKSPMTVEGQVNIYDGHMQMPWNIAVANLVGGFKFTEQGLWSTPIYGQLWQQPMVLTIDTMPATKQGTVIKAHIKGRVAAQDLQRNFSSKLLDNIQGISDYDVWLRLPHLGHERLTRTLSIASDLHNMAINLPKPFGKTLQQRVPLAIVTTWDAGKAPATVVHYGKLFTLAINHAIQQLEFTGPIIAGQMHIPARFPNTPLVGAFKYIHLPEAFSDNNTIINPANIFPMRLTVTDFSYGGKQLGTIFADLSPTSNGVNIDNLRIQAKGYDLSMQGLWQLLRGTEKTQLHGKLITYNLGALLQKWQLTENVAGGYGELQFALAADKVPWAIRLADVIGKMRLQFKDGRILHVGENAEVELGLGRVLNLLSLQTLARRLRLDFSDLLQSGFSFVKMAADFKLQLGDATTTNASLVGTVANVKVKGRIGVGQKDYDLKLAVTPYLTSSLPMVAAIAGGPIVGALTLFVDKIIGHEVKEITTYTYHVTGPWDNPQLQKL